jgi:16S rRNA G966 N2-methylase RsmD
MWRTVLRLLDAQPGWLAADGEIIVQIHPIEHQPVDLAHFELIDERKYGSTLLLFFAHPVEETDPR